MQNKPVEPSAVELVEELARRFQAGDFAAAFALYHPELRIEQPASLPHGGTHLGHEGVRTMGAVFAQYWDRTIENPRRMACAQGAVQLTTQTWTAKSTGRSATVDVVELFAVREGKISEIRVFQQDTQRLLATLGSNDADQAALRGQPKPWPRSERIKVLGSEVVARLAEHWEQGWNNEDAEVIVAGFHEDVVFSSPFVGRYGDDPSTHFVRGLPAVRQYVADSFVRATRGIKYTLDAAYASAEAVVLTYTVHHPTQGDLRGADTMVVDADAKVVEWRSHYAFER